LRKNTFVANLRTYGTSGVRAINRPSETCRINRLVLRYTTRHCRPTL